MIDGVPEPFYGDSGDMVPGAIPEEWTLKNVHPGHSHEPEFMEAFDEAWGAKSGTSGLVAPETDNDTTDI